MNRNQDPELLALIERLVDQKVTERLGDLEQQMAALRRDQTTDRASFFVFSGEFDRLVSAFILATGAAAMGMEVSMYFTFWGLVALKKKTAFAGKSLPETMLSMMLPGGPDKTATSNMNMLGVGPVFFKHLMAKNNVETLPDLIDLAGELGIRMIACKMAMGVMGIGEDELRDDLVYGGVATYLADAGDSRITLYV